MFDQVSSSKIFTTPFWICIYRVNSFREASTKAIPNTATVLLIRKWIAKYSCGMRIALELFLTKHRENTGKS